MSRKRGPKAKGYEQMTISLPPETIKAIKAISDQEMHGISSIVVRRIVAEWFDLHDGADAAKLRKAARK